MSEYYAVQRSGEYLEHYGVKGMKWGVRKAIQSGNSRALGRHYRKAMKKLAKLTSNADIQTQKDNQKKYAKRALLNYGVHVVRRMASGKSGSVLNKGYAETYRNTASSKHFVRAALSRSLAAERRTTEKGHAKAVAKRDTWRKEMQNAFKGTKYANLPKVKSRREEKADKYKKRSDTWRSTEKDMRNWAERTPHPGEARTNYLKVAKRASKKAKQYERKYLRIRGKN